MPIVARCLEAIRRAGRKLGPYLMLEILLPGGTLFALLLFFYRRSRLGSVEGHRNATPWTQALAGLLPQMLATQPAYARVAFDDATQDGSKGRTR